MASESPSTFNSGARMRCAFIADALHSCAEICVWSFSNQASETDPTRRKVQWEFREFPTIKFSLAAQFWRYLKAFFFRASIASDCYIDNVRKIELKNKLLALAPDVVILGNSHMGVLEPLVRKYAAQARLIMDTHNVEHLIFSRVSKTTTDFFKKMRLGILSYATFHNEKRFASACDEVWVVSEKDAAEFVTMGARQVVIVPNVIPLNQYFPRRLSGNRSIAFVGWYNYHPNEQAALFLIQCSKELALEGFEHQLKLIGRDPTYAMRKAVQNESQIKITGEVASASDEMLNSDVFAAPIFAGSGTKFKLLEAFALARAVVTTPLGTEGLNIADGQQALICKKEHFVAALKKIINNTEFAQTLATSGRSWIEQNLPLERVEKIIEERIKSTNNYTKQKIL